MCKSPKEDLAGGCLPSIFVVCVTVIGACSNTGAQSDSGTHAVFQPFQFAPSNIDVARLDVTGVGDFDAADTNCSIASDELRVSCGNGESVLKYQVVTSSDGTKTGVYIAKSFRIEPTSLLKVSGPYPTIIVALDKIEIFGGLDASADTYAGVAGGFTQTLGNSKGAGPGGGGAGTNSSAGGGGSFCGIGGAGAASVPPASVGGAAYGIPALTPLMAGSSGGSGAGGPGSGGGAVQLVAANSISIGALGWINVGGAGGLDGGLASQPAGGAGSGGAILIEAPVVSVGGVLAANGGGGGGTSALSGVGAGKASADDQPALGGGPPTSSGGRGSAGSIVSGGVGSPGEAPWTGGAGGGGAGRIRINSNPSQARITGILSPSLATICATQGIL